MAEPHHRPLPDAPAEDWEPYLRGRGFAPDTEPRPVTNYKSFHGFWVPPRLGSPTKPAATPSRAARTKRAVKIDPKWYSEKTLTVLFREHRPVFEALAERVNGIAAIVKSEEDAERLAAQRQLIEPAVEAGLLNQAEADRKIAAWAKTQGIKIPKSTD